VNLECKERSKTCEERSKRHEERSKRYETKYGERFKMYETRCEVYDKIFVLLITVLMLCLGALRKRGSTQPPIVLMLTLNSNH